MPPEDRQEQYPRAQGAKIESVKLSLKRSAWRRAPIRGFDWSNILNISHIDCHRPSRTPSR